MKSKIYNSVALFIITMITAGTLKAQNDRWSGDNRESPALGLKAGVNISNLYDTRGEDFEKASKIGFAGGAFLSLPIGRYVGIQPEVIYSQKGYKGSGNILNYTYTRTFDYLDIPLLIQLKPSGSLTVVGGPFYSFLLHKRINLEAGDLTFEQQTEIKNTNIRKNTLGITGGLDINLYPVVISGRVGWDLQHNNGDGTSTDPRFKNVWIQTTLGIVF